MSDKVTGIEFQDMKESIMLKNTTIKIHNNNDAKPIKNNHVVIPDYVICIEVNNKVIYKK